MNDPILEALSFELNNSNLDVESFRTVSADVGQTRTAGPSFQFHQSSVVGGRRLPTPKKNSKCILPSTVILGEDKKIPCLVAGCQYIGEPFTLKANKDAYLAHLLAEHRLVIDDVDEIANLYKYIIHWKERMASAPITEFCVGFVMDEVPNPPTDKRKGLEKEVEAEPAVPSPAQEKPIYYMLSPVLPEDKELRSKLWNGRLEAILEVNRQEREQQDFSRQCLLCREIFTGNRINIFEHMKTDHSFHIGKPDNIVFVEEFLELIAHKLNQLMCLHCEKTFKDKPVLRDHMRKKGHKRLNCNNPEYDRYYLVNYLEPGKDWKALECEDAEDERAEEDWVETNEETTNIVCLFCSLQSSSFEEILGHMKINHKFDFLETTGKCDFYQKVKIVNFIRRTVFLNSCFYCEKKFSDRCSLLQHIVEHGTKNPMNFPPAQMWDQPEYYFPTYENDQFLVLLDNDNSQDDEQSTMASSNERLVIPEDPPQISLRNPADLHMDLT